MPDFRLDWTGRRLAGDLVRDGARFAEDGGLETAVLLSLFTDRRAGDDDELPDGSRDRRGYWGDGISEVEGDRYGSRLWLLRRAKLTNETVNRAREYVLEALEWMREDGVASEIRVVVEIGGRDRLDIGVEIDRAVEEPVRFEFQWSRIAGVIRRAA